MVEREERKEIGICAAKTEFLSVTEREQCFFSKQVSTAGLWVTIQSVRHSFPNFPVLCQNRFLPSNRAIYVSPFSGGIHTA